MVQKKKIWIAIVTGVVVLAPLWAPLFWPWSEINCRHEEIDIRTGQARYSRYVCFIRISREVKETPLSRALGGRAVEAAEVESWHYANTFTPWRHHSPHYRYHSALSQADSLGKCFDLFVVPEAVQEEIAESVLTLWQTGGNYQAADRYIFDQIERIQAEYTIRGDS